MTAAEGLPPGPGGYAVVLFGGEADGWCSLNKCPMEVSWWATREEAERWADWVPAAFEPHIFPLTTQRLPPSAGMEDQS